MKTDHNSLRFFLEQKHLQERQQKWVIKIQAYEFDIDYVKGKRNIVVDALSRIPTALSLRGMDADWKAQLLVEYSKDKFVCEILDAVIVYEWYIVMDEVIYYQDWVFLAKNSKLKRRSCKHHMTPHFQGIKDSQRLIGP